jgi:amino acid transporter
MSENAVPESPEQPSPLPQRIPIIVATSVMLTFISFWRAAAIVLCDLGSSAFYVGGISEKAVGSAAPWFVLGVMCFSYAVRAVYIESCVLFVRGGVYRVVKAALGAKLAKFSVSALMFDYVLTGPISGVSAGQYLVGLANEVFDLIGLHWAIPRGPGAAVSAVAVTLYFWRKNVIGIHESSDKALRIMQVTTVMVVLMIIWCGTTLLVRGGNLPPAPVPENLTFSPESLGWLHGTDWARTIGLLGILIAFGHSILAMSGEESLAQVNREIAYPKVKNLKRAALVIFVFSILFTSLVSFFAVMIIPDSTRPEFHENLISGLAMNVVGPYPLRLAFQLFVVLVGFLMLSGAVNTSIIGSNGVLNRVSEDGVLSSWFRQPHRRYGTSYRIINLIVILQIGTIVASGGDTYVLGEAYAFGVLWSFVFNSLSMLVLRFKNREPREWRVPLNIRWGRKEIPLGILLVLLVLLATATVNLLTKQVATISGLVFTAAFFTLFTISERVAKRKREGTGLDQFQLIREEKIDLDVVQVRAAPVLVTVRDYKTLKQLTLALSETDTKENDVVVMTARIIQGSAAGYREIFDEHLFTEFEQLLFTRVVATAEKMGKPVKLLTVPSNNPFAATVNTAVLLGCIRMYAGASEKLSITTQARLVGKAWEEIDDPDKTQFEFVIVGDQGEPHRFQIGAHAPDLAPEDIELIHRIWLEITEKVPEGEFHHRDVVSLALNRFNQEFKGPAGAQILDELKKSSRKPVRKKTRTRF